MKLKKLKILMNLWVLTLLGKHTKKADVIKKVNLFKSYGGDCPKTQIAAE